MALRLWTYLFAAFFLSLPAEAMSVSPTQVELLSAGSSSHARITVVNTSHVALPVEAIIKRATLNEAGAPTTTASPEDFLVIPPQAILAPGATQVFRVQWVGEPLLLQSQSYFLYISQVPLKLTKDESRVQVVFSMGVMINVAPPKGQPKLRLVSAGVSVGKNGWRHPTITVQNTSNVHALLPNATIRLSAGNWSQILDSATLDTSIGVGLVQPGRRRKFVLPCQLPPGVERFAVAIDYKKRR